MSYTPYGFLLSWSAIVCACSTRFVTAAAKPTSNLRGEGERRDGTGEARGEPYGLCIEPRGDRGETGVVGREGDRLPLRWWLSGVIRGALW